MTVCGSTLKKGAYDKNRYKANPDYKKARHGHTKQTTPPAQPVSFIYTFVYYMYD